MTKTSFTHFLALSKVKSDPSMSLYSDLSVDTNTVVYVKLEA